MVHVDAYGLQQSTAQSAQIVSSVASLTTRKKHAEYDAVVSSSGSTAKTVVAGSFVLFGCRRRRILHCIAQPEVQPQSSACPREVLVPPEIFLS
jgi:hypothetical protein